jgi:hypothetical protein
MSKDNSFDAVRNALDQAARAGRRGDLRAAERWAKNSETLSRALERIAAEPAPVTSAEEDEALRAELRRRLALFVAADLECQRWEADAEAYEAQLFAALANGVRPPEPLRPHPSGPMGEEAWLKRIALEGE